MAKNQQNRSLLIPAMRGNVYFKDGSPFAVSEISYFVFAEPKSLDKDKIETLIDFVSTIAPLSEDTKDKLTRDLWYVPLIHGVSEKQKEDLEKLVPKGIYYKKEYKRYLPETELGKSIIGLLGSDKNGDQQGYWGIEGYYNSDLMGRSGAILAEVDATGTPIIFGSYSEIPQVTGRSIVLSIDRSIQYFVETSLKNYLLDFDAKSASAIIMDPTTGSVIAMVDLHKPSIDITEGNAVPETLVYINNNIGATYEPGSVFKALSMSAAIDTNTVTPQTSFLDDGAKYYSGYKIDNWNGKHFGLETMYGVLEHSNNMGAAYVAEKLGSEKLWRYYAKFGIGSPLGIDMEGEQTGYLPDWRGWSDIDLVTTAFGQGVSATPLQVVTAFSAISNGGDLLKPYLAVIAGKENSRGFFEEEVLGNKRTIIGKVMSLSSSNTMIEMLGRAATFGEAKYFISKKYKVAGKTGTAQIPVPGGYDPEKTNATFVGFLPESRKFVMLVKFEEPTKSIFAAETAVPAWMSIAEKLADYYRIPEDF